jgi:4-hydroxy-tetrahydrodipicolinate reductase
MTPPRRVCVVGALGRMGAHVREALAAEPRVALAAALEAPGHPRLGETLEGGARVESDPSQALAGADVLIDFSVPASTLRVLPAAAESRVACVIGTTGFDAAARAQIERAAGRVPIVLAPNFSVAVNVLARLVRDAALLLGSGYDAEIVELHHAAKRDAPSGTALRLARAIADARGQDPDAAVLLQRAGEVGERKPGAIGIQALRGGDNPGEHTVVFLGRGERLELVHRTATRDHFAAGAVRAALWLAGRPPGLYGMEEVLGL